MTTSRKLWLGFGTLTALLVLSSVLIILRVRSIEGQVGDLANIARTRSATARQLEINVIDYALAVHEYLHVGDPKAKEEADEEAADVERERAEYERLAMTDRQRELATRFVAMWNEMHALGRTILNAENRQPRREDVTRFHDLRTGLEKFLDDEVQVDAFDAYNARRDATLQDVQTIVGFALILLIVGMVIAVVTCGAVGRGVFKAEGLVRENRELLRVTLASIGDAVMTTDTQGRVTSLNSVAESLTGWTKDEAAGRPLEEVFRIINEETRRTVENPVNKVLAERNIVGLANHTVLISKDGTERPIDDSAAPIRDAEGRVLGVVLIFRDIVERRQAELVLAEQERLLRLGAEVGTALTVDGDLRDVLQSCTESMVRNLDAAFARIWTLNDKQGVLELRASAGLYTHLDGPHGRVPVGQFKIGLIAQERKPHLTNAVVGDPRVPEQEWAEREGMVAFAGYPLLIEDRLMGVMALFARHPLSEITLEAMESVASEIALGIQHRKAKAALRGSEVRYRRLFETAQDGILILDADTAKITDANPFIGELLGYSHAELLGKELWEIGLFQDKEASKAAARELQEKHYIRYEDLPLQTQAGRRADVEFVSNVYTEDHVSVIQCNIRDITERKRLQDTERQSQHRLRFVMDSMPQKIFTAKPNGDVDYFNPQLTEFTGLSFEQIRDWGWTQFIHPDDVAENVRVWQQSIDTGEPFSFEHRFRSADGEYRWHLSRAVPLRDAEGKVVMWVGSSTDVHEQRQTANKLRQFAADLSEADHRKNEFLAMLAHELRNPLGPIRNALQIMRLTGGNGEAVHSASEMMERQVGQMVRLVDDLLDVSRISRGKIELRKARIELASVVHHAVEAARPLTESTGHELTVTLPPKPIYMHADPTRLAQVVGNLLNNACKYTEKGGRISLTVEREGEQAIIQVRDTGIGIAADQLPLIFEMFTQVDASLERSQSGLGIGLTLVKKLVEMHNGTVEVQSAGVGQGSEFVVRLPVMAETLKPAPPEPTLSEPTPTTARRILVVDDNRDSAESLTLLLQLSGHEIYTAYDGIEAVEAAATFRPDVILLDIGLPKLNGYEAARQIREQPWGKKMVLVALTGWGQDEDRQKSKDAGFNDHLVKPVDTDALTKLLAELQPTQAPI